MLMELNRCNHRFSVYRKFIAGWETWLDTNYPDLKEFSVLEVGSGSGGLSKEILKSAERRGLKVKIHLFDVDPQILERAREFIGADVGIHIASETYLRALPMKQFDFVISLHVIHHIQPLAAALEALDQMIAVAKQGVYVVDLESRRFGVVFTWLWNTIFGVSKDLNHDGVLSMKRAYKAAAIDAHLRKFQAANSFAFTVTRLRFFPYWVLSVVCGR